MLPEALNRTPKTCYHPICLADLDLTPEPWSALEAIAARKGVSVEQVIWTRGFCDNKMGTPVYIGDAIYACYDGNGIELRLNHHEAPYAVYLEPEVIAALQAWIKTLND
jgi:hypothetical protein